MEIIDKVTEKKPDNTFLNGLNKAQDSGPLDHVSDLKSLKLNKLPVIYCQNMS